ncbi:MAG: hypothetical protein ACI9C4_000954 [Paraglaciecola sp.]|jgi:hypothetical protein
MHHFYLQRDDSKNNILLMLTLIASAGCASQRLSDGEKSIIIKNFISAEKLETRSTISAFNMDSWTSLSDQYLILRTSPSRPYWLKLMTRCHNLNLSLTLIIDSAIANSLSSGFDAIYTQYNQEFKCNISRIYPLSKEQNKALIAAVTPVAKEKSIKKAGTTDKKTKTRCCSPDNQL